MTKIENEACAIRKWSDKGKLEWLLEIRVIAVKNTMTGCLQMAVK